MTPAERQDILNDAVRRIVNGFHPDKIILFGSYVTGQPTDDSDLDILIVMPVTGSSREKANEIDLALGDRMLPMDLIVVTPEQFERQKDMMGTIIREAVLEGRVVYEQAA